MRFALLLLLSLALTATASANSWIFVESTSSTFPLISDVAGLDVECDLDTASSDSYSGSGTDLLDLSPGGACDMTLSAGVGFAGSAGTSSAYLDFDSGDYAYMGSDEDSASGEPDFTTNMVRGDCSGTDCDWWVAFHFQAADDPQSAAYRLFGNQNNTSDVAQSNFVVLQTNGNGAPTIANENSTLNYDSDNGFVLLPNQEQLIIISYDDSENTLTHYYNSYIGIDYSVDLGTASGDPSVAFHLFSNGYDTHSFNDMQFYGFSAGEGYVTEAQAKGIAEIYNERRSREVVPTDECGLVLSDCVAGVFAEWNMGDTLSWTTDNTTIKNTQAVPYDGATQASYDLTIENDAEFTGAPGVPGTYIKTDNDGHLSLTMSSSVPALYGAMDHTAGNNTWCAIAFKTPTAIATGTPALFGNADDNETGAMGWGAYYQAASGPDIWLVYRNGTAEETHDVLQTLSATTNYNIIVGLNTYDTSSGGQPAHVYYLNDDTSGGISNDIDDFDNGVDVATGDLIFGGTWDYSASEAVDLWGDGGGIYAMACSQILMTDAIAGQTMRWLENVSYTDADGDGSIGAINSETLRGEHKLAAQGLSTAEVTGYTVSGSEIDGLRFKFFDASLRARLHAIAVVVSGSNVVDDLTQVTWGTSNDFSSIAAGEMTADWSSGSTKDIHLFDQSTLQSGTANVENNVYLEFASSVDIADIDHIYYCANHNGANDIASGLVTIYDNNGNELTLTDEPTVWSDTEGGSTSNGIFSVDGDTCFRKAYRFGLN